MKEIIEKAKAVFEAKKWVRVTTYTVVILVILLIVVFLTLGQIIKGSAAALGPVIAGVPVKIESVSVGLLGSFKMDLKGLTVGNPEGYSETPMLKLQDLYLEVETASLLRKKIVVKQIRIKGVDVNFETNLISSNLAEVDKNTKKLAGENAKPQPLQVNDLLMEDVKVAVCVKGTSAGVPVPIAPLHLQDLGTGEDGITPAGLVQELLANLLTGATGVLKSGAASVGDATTSAVKGLKGLFSSGKKDRKAPAKK